MESKRVNRNRDLFVDLHLQISMAIRFETSMRVHICLSVKYEICVFGFDAVIHITFERISSSNSSIFEYTDTFDSEQIESILAMQ